MSPTVISCHPQHRSPSTTLSKASRIIIVGAGTFGLSTAYHLLGRGYTNVMVLDRAKKVPAVDAAGTDINKVVRSCYNDIFYTKLAKEAMEAWRQPMWQGCYHECGVVFVGGEKFDIRSRTNDIQAGVAIEDLPDADAIKSKVLSSLQSLDRDSKAQCVGSFTDSSGYFNPEGGWAEATRAVEIILSRVKEMGGRVIEGQEVTGLVKDADGRTTGVKCKDGEHFEGDVVILTIGAWTASTFPELELDWRCLATGQSVATIQLSAEEKKRYEGCHIYLDYQTGLYTFPVIAPPPSLICGVKNRLQQKDSPTGSFWVTEEPTEDGIVKLAMHSAGHTHMAAPKRIGGDIDCGPVRRISTPRTITSHPDSDDGLRVPRSALRALREHLRQVYPELALKPWAGTRMCWYTDSPDGNWIIGPYPGDATLLLATSGSGHAFKFLPNVGRLVVDSLEGKLDVATAARFAVDRDLASAMNGERALNGPTELDVGELCCPEDFN